MDQVPGRERHRRSHASALDLVVRQIALRPVDGCHRPRAGTAAARPSTAASWHCERTPSWAMAVARALLRRAGPAADGGDQPWLEQLRQALHAAAGGARAASGECNRRSPNAGEVPTFRPSALPPCLRGASLAAVAARSGRESHYPALPPHRRRRRLYPKDPPATSTVRPPRHAAAVIERNPRDRPCDAGFEEKPAPCDSWTAAEDARARSAPETPPRADDGAANDRPGKAYRWPAPTGDAAP